MKNMATTTYGVKLKWNEESTWATRNISTTPTKDNAVSFCKAMKSLRSGGMTRRTACGMTTNRSPCIWLSPSALAAAR